MQTVSVFWDKKTGLRKETGLRRSRFLTAEVVKEDLGIFQIPVDDLPIAEAALALQGIGQIPVVDGGVDQNARLFQRGDQLFVIGDPGGIDLANLHGAFAGDEAIHFLAENADEGLRARRPRGRAVEPTARAARRELRKDLRPVRRDEDLPRMAQMFLLPSLRP